MDVQMSSEAAKVVVPESVLRKQKRREEGEGPVREEEVHREPQAHLHSREAVRRGVRCPGQIAAPARKNLYVDCDKMKCWRLLN